MWGSTEIISESHVSRSSVRLCVWGKIIFFLIISMSLHIQNQNQHQNTVQLWIWAMNTLVANDQRSDYLDPKHQEKLRLVQEISVSTPSSKIIWSVWMAALRKGPKNIFLTHKTFTQFYVSVRQGLMRKEKKLKCFIMCLCTWCRKQISWVKCKNIRYVY